MPHNAKYNKRKIYDMKPLKFRKKETVDKKVFKVNLGDGIEILTCEELRYRFDNLTKKEQDYLNKNARKCPNITDINLDISNVTSYKDVFNAP